MSGSAASGSQFVERLAFLGVAQSDDDQLRLQKATLTLAAVTVTVLAIFWVGTYLALGLPLSAAIPFAYQLVSIASLAVFARTKDYRFLRFSQLVLIIALPFLLQWSLGGYVASSAVSLWALVGAFGALFFYSASAAVPWFLAVLALTAVSGLLEPIVSNNAASIPVVIRTTFFVLNVSGVAVTAYLLLQYAVRARDAAMASSERLLLNILPKSIADRLKREEGRIAETHGDVTVLFADVVDFTPFVERTEPHRVVAVLDEIFSAFDRLAERHGLENKTIGDAYDLWGDTVNTASRMESSGLPGRIQVTAGVYERLRELFRLEERGEVDVKGKGRLLTYLLLGRREPELVPG